VQLCCGQPHEVWQVPLGLWNLFIVPTLAGLHDPNSIALLCGAEGGNAPTKAGADNHHVIVEVCHSSFLSIHSSNRQASGKNSFSLGFARLRCLSFAASAIPVNERRSHSVQRRSRWRVNQG